MDARRTAIDTADGTTLAAAVRGAGTPMVMVHGATGSRGSWAFVVETLAEQHTVWTYDRRGRGDSGDVTPYAYEREVDDVVSVVRAAGSGAHLVAHSFGARIALDAALAIDDLASAVLYEPPIHVDHQLADVEEAAGLIEAGDHEAGLLVFFERIAGLTPHEVAMIRSVPTIWQRVVATAATAAREVRALAGSDRAVLIGQGHIGFSTDPGGFVEAVLAHTSTVEAAGRSPAQS